MFRQAIDDKEAEKITRLTEVKSMITQIAEQIEARGEKRGMQQKAGEDALRMKKKDMRLRILQILPV